MRQNGVELMVPGNEVTRCHVHPAIPRMLVVESPAPLLARGDESIEMSTRGTSRNGR